MIEGMDGWVGGREARLRISVRVRGRGMKSLDLIRGGVLRRDRYLLWLRGTRALIRRTTHRLMKNGF